MSQPLMLMYSLILAVSMFLMTKMLDAREQSVRSRGDRTQDIESKYSEDRDAYYSRHKLKSSKSKAKTNRDNQNPLNEDLENLSTADQYYHELRLENAKRKSRSQETVIEGNPSITTAPVSTENTSEAVTSDTSGDKPSAVKSALSGEVKNTEQSKSTESEKDSKEFKTFVPKAKATIKVKTGTDENK